MDRGAPAGREHPSRVVKQPGQANGPTRSDQACKTEHRTTRLCHRRAVGAALCKGGIGNGQRHGQLQ
jgi:hypothetical protein